MIEYRYDTPFKFTGQINQLTFKLEPFTQPQGSEAGAAKHAQNR